MGRHSKIFGGLIRGNRCSPPFSMWRWTQWCVTGYNWYKEAREERTGGEGR